MSPNALAEILTHEFKGEDARHLVQRRGQFHEVIIGATKAVSIAKTQHAASRLQNRAQKLRAISELLPTICTPKVIELHDTYMVMTKVPGVPFGELESIFESTSTKQIAIEIGRILEEFQKVDPSQAPVTVIGSTPVNRWIELADRVENSLFPLMSITGRDRAKREMEDISKINPVGSRLIHGDLGGTNIHWTMVDGRPEVAGILDWDEVQIGDIAIDLAALQATFSAAVVEQTAAKLDLSDEVLVRVKTIQNTFALQQALAGFDDNDQDALNDGLRDYR